MCVGGKDEPRSPGTLAHNVNNASDASSVNSTGYLNNLIVVAIKQRIVFRSIRTIPGKSK